MVVNSPLTVRPGGDEQGWRGLVSPVQFVAPVSWNFFGVSLLVHQGVVDVLTGNQLVSSKSTPLIIPPWAVAGQLELCVGRGIIIISNGKNLQ